MSITRRGKIYWLDIRLAGKRIRRSLHTDNKNIAFQKFRDLQDELVAEYSKTDIKLSDFIKQFMEWAWNEKPKSAYGEQCRLKLILNYFEVKLEIKHLSDITPYHIEQLKAELKGKDLSKSTINRYLQTLRKLFNKAIDWEMHQKINPLKKVKFYFEKSEVKVLSLMQVKRVLNAAKEISDHYYSPAQKVFYDMCVLALNTGMRKSEILNLQWKDIRDEEAKIEGKGERKRTIPLNKIALEIINRQVSREKFVFDIPNRHQNGVIHKTVVRVGRISGVKWTFHLLRHRFATSLIENGVDLITVSALLGHSKLTTSLIYSHTDETRKRKAVDLISKE